jgi:hypothetical protein
MKEGFQARLTTSCPMKRKWHSSPCDVGLPICSHLGFVWFWADMLHDYAREKKPLRMVDGPRTRFIPSYGCPSCIGVYISISLFGCPKKKSYVHVFGYYFALLACASPHHIQIW